MQGDGLVADGKVGAHALERGDDVAQIVDAFLAVDGLDDFIDKVVRQVGPAGEHGARAYGFDGLVDAVVGSLFPFASKLQRSSLPNV